MSNIQDVFNVMSHYKVFYAVLILLFGMLVLHIAVMLVKRILKKSKLDPALHTFFLNIVRIAGLVIILVACLDKLGVNTTSFVAVLGAAGAAIALALKDSLANVAGGIMILVTKPFGQGDYVNIGGTMGFVEEINVITTSLKTDDNQLVMIPNGMVSTSVVTNYYKTEDRRTECIVSVDYDSDLDIVKKAIKEAASGSPYTVRDKECVVGVMENADSGMNIRVLTWTRPNDHWANRYYMEEHIKLNFDKYGINMPYPVQTVILENRTE